MDLDGLKLETPRLLLRKPIAPDDAPRIFSAYAHDPEVTRYLAWRAYDRVEPLNVFLRECIATWEKADAPGAAYAWLLSLKGTDTPIGKMYGVNLGCLEDVSEAELEALSITYVDGRDDRWQDAPAFFAHL